MRINQNQIFPALPGVPLVGLEDIAGSKIVPNERLNSFYVNKSFFFINLTGNTSC